jgi:glutamine amidotransferase PdxT
MKIIGVLDMAQSVQIIDALKKAVHALGQADGIEFRLFTNPEDMKHVDALVIPRGSSIMFTRHIFSDAWKHAFENFHRADKPILTICGSAIVFARELGKECEGRSSHHLLSVRVDNNVIDGDCEVIAGSETNKPVRCCMGNFTDAPVFTPLHPEVEVLYTCEAYVVAVRDGSQYAYSFYDETGMAYVPFVKGLMRA